MKQDALTKLIQLSMYHHAKYVANLLAQGRTERQVKSALSKKVKGKASDQGIDMVYQLGCRLHREQKDKELPVMITTKSPIIIHPEYGNN